MEKPRSASQWLVRLNSPDCSAAERAAFADWLEASPANARAYERCNKLWRLPRALATDARLFADLAELIPSSPQARRADGPIRSRFVRTAIPLAWAASVLVVLFFAAQYFRPTPLDQVSTGPAEQRTLSLPDGSTVTLNARTTLAMSFTQHERTVELPQGEAFFSVKHDAARPFVVKAGRTLVRAVGTQFSVRRESDHVEVVVREGRVEVIPDSSRPIGDAAIPMTVPLAPNRRLEFAPSASRLEVAYVNADEATEWRSGILRFESTTLERMIAEMNRYIERPITIEDESLRGLEVSGRFRVGDTQGLLFALRERFGIQVSDEGDSIVLRASADRRAP